MRWTVVAGVLGLVSVGDASPWLGFAQLAASPTQGVQVSAQLVTSETRVRGRIAACRGDGPCPLGGARLALDVGSHDPAAREEVERLTGTITLADGTSCTFVGDVWDVEVRRRRVRRGAVHGQVTCPTFGLAVVSLWVKGYRQPRGLGG